MRFRTYQVMNAVCAASSTYILTAVVLCTRYQVPPGTCEGTGAAAAAAAAAVRACSTRSLYSYCCCISRVDAS